MSDSGRVIGECEHGSQRWHCETCKLRAVADRLAEALEASLAVLKHPDPCGHPALAEYRKAVSGG